MANRREQMIEPITSLAFSIQSSKGVYALFLGSGVSVASVPSVWDIEIDLTRKFAVANGTNLQDKSDEDVAKWLIESHNFEPNYSFLLKNLAPSPADRQAILKQYFEPKDDKSVGLSRKPTKAHQAIAKLIKSGHIKIVITTNFDRLLENALQEESITPIVLCTDSQFQGQGVLPITHPELCTIVKVHGDYMDPLIKNTEVELSTYSGHLNRLLDRIFDEYGLIICGWSGTWDPALREALERCPSHRFSTYWTVLPFSTFSEKAKVLSICRKAQLITIKNADDFFMSLQEQVYAIETFDQSHPLTRMAAVATVKRYIEDTTQNIRLHDVLNQEAENVFNKTRDAKEFPLTYPTNNRNEWIPFIKTCIKRYETICEKLIAMSVPVAYWGKSKEQYRILLNVADRLAERNHPVSQSSSGYITLLEGLRYFPLLLFCFGMNLASLAGENYSFFADFNSKKCLKDGQDQGTNFPLHYLISSWNYFMSDFHSFIGDCKISLPIQKNLEIHMAGITRLDSYVSRFYQHIADYLLQFLQEYLPNSETYKNTLFFHEYLIGTMFYDEELDFFYKQFGPFTTFLDSFHSYDPKMFVLDVIEGDIGEKIDIHNEKWEVLKSGLFRGSLTRFQQAQNQLRNKCQNSRRGM
jgi:hypothetical protein